MSPDPDDQRHGFQRGLARTVLCPLGKGEPRFGFGGGHVEHVADDWEWFWTGREGGGGSPECPDGKPYDGPGENHEPDHHCTRKEGAGGEWLYYMGQSRCSHPGLTCPVGSAFIAMLDKV